QDRAVRGGPRQRPGPGGQGLGEPDRAITLGGDDAPAHRPARSRRADRALRGADAAQAHRADARPGRRRHDGDVDGAVGGEPRVAATGVPMALLVTLIQGGGAGFDQVPAVQRILQAAGADIEWDEYLAGFAAVERGLPPLPEAMLRRVCESGLALKTKLLVPPDGKRLNYNVQFRRALGLFA